MKSLAFIPILFILFLQQPAGTADQIDNITLLLRKGNIDEIAKQFADKVDVAILDREYNYTQDKATAALKDFFTQNRPKAVKVLHRVNTNNTYLYGVMSVDTDKATYRVSFTLRSIKGSLQIIDVRIESEK